MSMIMKKHRYIIQVILITTFLHMQTNNTSHANESNWPQFRGSNASGLPAKGQNPPIKFGPTQNVLWKTTLPSGHSSPCIWGNHIFLTGFDKDKQQLYVFCLNRNNGHIRWRRNIPTEQIEKVHPISSPANATPATDGERIYLYFGSCGLLCYDFEGKLLWTVPMPIPSVRFGSGTSPIVSDGIVILNRIEGKDPHLLAVDCRSGKTVWKQSQLPTASALAAFGATSYSTPVIWGEQFVIHHMGEIVAHAIKDGSRIWSVGTITNGVSTPVIGNNILYVGTWSNLGEPEFRLKLPDFQTMVRQYDTNGNLQISKIEFPDDLAVSHRPETGNVLGGKVTVKPFFNMFDVDKNGSINETEWKGIFALISALSQEHGLVAIKPDGKGDITSTHILWQEKKDVPEVPAPLHYKGRIYMIKNGGIASCMDAISGKLLYRERLGASGPYYSSPICANSRIYIASRKGILVVFHAQDTLEVLAKNNLKEEVFATPAVVDNKLYVRTVNRMYAFGE
jgi:outer membrane protein assembly factor BamB